MRQTGQDGNSVYFGACVCVGCVFCLCFGVAVHQRVSLSCLVVQVGQISISHETHTHTHTLRVPVPDTSF